MGIKYQWVFLAGLGFVAVLAAWLLLVRWLGWPSWTEYVPAGLVVGWLIVDGLRWMYRRRK